MARTPSLAQMIFFLVRILAPSIGQVLPGIGSWRFIFYMLAGFDAFVLAWAALRPPRKPAT